MGFRDPPRLSENISPWQKPFTGGDELTFDDFAAALLYDTQAQGFFEGRSGQVGWVVFLEV